jgi:EPS-associated MarR family transcriptional regulator
MASKREYVQEEVRLRILRIVNKNPNIKSREIARILKISNGSAYYCINSLIQKGMIKLKNFSSHKKKAKYTYFLTPSGIYEKTILTAKFLQTKLKEYEELKTEIREMEEEVSAAKKNISFVNRNLNIHN